VNALRAAGLAVGLVALILSGPAAAQQPDHEPDHDPYADPLEPWDEPMPDDPDADPELEDPYAPVPDADDPDLVDPDVYDPDMVDPERDEPEAPDTAPPFDDDPAEHILDSADEVSVHQTERHTRVTRERRTYVDDFDVDAVDDPFFDVDHGIGVGLSIGGGGFGFVDSTARDFTDVGGSWEARLSVGTRSPIALEAAYVGSAQGIDAIGLDPDAILVGNGVEGVARINLGRAEIQPFVFGGAGWRHYRVTNADFNLSNVSNRDNVLEVPLGAGLAWRTGGVFFDVRGTYRLAFFDDLISPGPADAFSGADLDSWNATLRLGFEF
jgi:hypothetical protein